MDMKDISNALENLVTLDIRTVVGNFSHDENGLIQAGQGAHEMVTRINLFSGDVTTAFSEELLDESLAEVRAFHSQREQQGMDIIRSNINALYSLTRLVKTLDDEEKNANNPAPANDVTTF